MSTKYVQCLTQFQAGAGSIMGATSVVLTSLTDIYGNVLTMTDFGTKGYCTAEPDTNNEESFTFTGIIANANGTYTLTGVATTLAKSPYTETSGLVRQHSGGTKIVITDNVAFWNTFGNKTNDEVITGRWTTGITPTNPNDLVNKAYVDGVAISGGADASTTVKGISKLSTAPVSGTNPIAVGDNDTRVPTQNENDALVGTSGTAVSSSNKLVDNADTTGTGLIVRSSVTNALPKPTDIQVFSTAGNYTWTKPSGVIEVEVYAIGGGGGGGGGAGSIGGNSSGGGGGGGGGSLGFKKFNASSLGSTENITIGAGGTGGAGATGNASAGTDGGTTSFGTTVLLQANGGTKGGGGTTSSAGTIGIGGIIGNGDVTQAGGSGILGDQGTDTSSLISPRAGGSGINGNSSSNGVGGGFITNYVKAGGALGTIGNSSIGLFYGGTGGGGGAGGTTGQTGGNGINGSGAGGGGAKSNGTGGTGGIGGAGFVIVISYF